ncbi:T9SS type A sorting domain-containing protein [Dysgonomonas sp. 520]|uniref:T9SS type A sorting domain-containing protein n=1 Tax=Dysgonomonas sp. 520 TaxID=2302931 RepID=UPI0013D77E73|nr:T9SS type A sorting domain-containing protein [Dysgonomonas sp. 520]NDW08216.1 T9SS C-terminal target domain-containing protein [Dysgonomonas sp. 520]
MKMRLFTTSVLMCVMLFSTQSFARRVYVKLASDATAWAHVTANSENVVITLPSGSTDFVGNVLSTLQKGDEVWVAKGEYTNTGKLALQDDDVNGYVYGGITLYGGFAGTETDPSQRALSDKDGNGLVEAWEFVNETNFKGAGNSADKASKFQMIHLGQGSILDGVTVSDNYYTGSNQASGGVVAATATIRNCIVRDLTVEGKGTVNGGGLYVTGGHVESCLFESCTNIASAAIACYGGALLIYGIADNVSGTPTGYIKNSVIRNCKAGQDNNVGRGGAIFGKSGVIVENCVIYNNSVAFTNTASSGAAFYFHGVGDANLHVNRIIGCTVVNNCSPYCTISESEFIEVYNTVFWGNSSADYPAIDGTSYNANIRMKANASLSNAYPFLDGIAHNGTILNSDIIRNASFSPVLLGGALNDLTGNQAPKFKNATEFQGVALGASDLDEIRKANWTLVAESPMIDAGVNAPSNANSGISEASLAASFSGVDALGLARNVGKFDIGAYEFGATSGIANEANDALFRMYVIGGVLTVDGLEEVSTIEVYGLNGTLVSSATVNASSATLPLYNKGVYVVSVKSNNQKYSQKVVF